VFGAVALCLTPKRRWVGGPGPALDLLFLPTGVKIANEPDKNSGRCGCGVAYVATTWRQGVGEADGLLSILAIERGRPLLMARTLSAPSLGGGVQGLVAGMTGRTSPSSDGSNPPGHRRSLLYRMRPFSPR
jgi:hypothetical protein